MTFALSEHAVLLARIGSSKFLLYAFKSASDGRELSVQFADGTTAHAGITLAPLAEKTCHVFCGQLSQDKGVPRVVVAVYVTGRNQSVLLAPVDNPEAPYSVKFDSKWLTEPRESKVFDSQRAMDDFVSTALLAHATSVAALRAKEAGEVTPVSAPKTKPRSRVSDADSPADGAGAVVTVDRNQLESLKEKANSFGSLSAELNGVLSAVKKTASGTSASLTTLTNTANEILKAVNRLGTATTPGSAGATTTAVVDDAVVKAVTAKLVLQVQESVAAAELRIMQHMDAQMVKLTASIEAARHGASSMPPPPQVAYYPQYGTPHVLVHHQYPPGSSAPAPQQQVRISCSDEQLANFLRAPSCTPLMHKSHRPVTHRGRPITLGPRSGYHITARMLPGMWGFNEDCHGP